MISHKTIILASQSRDRHRLLSNAAIPHRIIVSNYPETHQSNLTPSDLTLNHARGKVECVCRMIESQPQLINTPHYIIIAADTIVNLNNEILGKAKNKVHAIEMLKKLMGKTHSLITGVVIYDSESASMVEHVDKTDVKFITLSGEEVEAYVMFSEEYKWRAGSYSMFDRASVFIESISGSPSNVIGLPMDFVYTQLKKLGINILTIEKEKE